MCVESNFVLGLARAQEQSPSCEALMTLAEEAVLRLAIPAYSLAEPNETLRRSEIERTDFAGVARKVLGLVARSASLSGRAIELADGLSGLLFETQAEEWARLHEVRARLAALAAVLPLTKDTVLSAQHAERTTSLKPQDALVWASVLDDLKATGARPSLLLTRDKGFDDPDLRAVLQDLGCDVIVSYDHGLERVRAGLRR